MERLFRRTLDYPLAVTTVSAILVLLHAMLARQADWLDVWSAAFATTSDARTVYLSLAGAAAISAGFAGVIIVFGLSTNSHAFRLFRRVGGKRLRASWLSIIGSAFAATLLSLIAGITADTWVAAWLFELGLVLWVHGVLRMLFLIFALMKGVEADDAASGSSKRTISSENLFRANEP